MSTAEVRGETTFVEVGDKKIQLLKGGQGPPLLYLHSAAGETDWIPFYSLLAEHFTLYIPAHPGFALSTGLDQIDDIHDLAWHYVDLLDVLELENVPVVGFSLGGWLGTELAILRPRRVNKLVLIDAAGLRVEGAPMAELFVDDLRELKELVFYDPDAPEADLAIPGSLEDARILQWLRAREATARLGWNPYLHDPKLAENLRRVECPTLVVWGRHDKLIPLAHGEYYAEHIRNARLEVLDECGHMAPFEKSEALAAMAVEFLKR